MAKPMHPTPMLDELESGPWPSFVTGLKRLAKEKDLMVDVLGQLETSYRTKKGYWKGGTVGVFGYGGGIIPRFRAATASMHPLAGMGRLYAENPPATSLWAVIPRKPKGGRGTTRKG